MKNENVHGMTKTGNRDLARIFGGCPESVEKSNESIEIDVSKYDFIISSLRGEPANVWDVSMPPLKNFSYLRAKHTH